MPEISVIIPLFNKERDIERCLDSVLSQDFSDFEVIVVNDGSTDGSMGVVNTFSDSRIAVVSQPNGGPSKARNTGAKLAKAPWIYFLDADDEVLPGAFSHFIKLASEHPEADIFDCGRYVGFKGKKTLQPHLPDGWVKNLFKEFYFKRLYVGANYSLFKSSIVLANPFEENIRRFEDAEVLFRMFRAAKLYSSSHPVAVHHVDSSEASRPRKNVSEDFFGHLRFHEGSFWERMCSYRFYIEEKAHYSKSSQQLYPIMKWRVDLVMIHHLLQKLNQ